MPIVDIIIPVFNRANQVKRAIQSVQNQNFKDFKLWVVNDGSTDNTSIVLKKYISEFPKGQMSVLSVKKNKGVSTARNIGIRAGKANWIALLDSDDEWLPDKLKYQMEWVKQNDHHKLIHTNERWMREGLEVPQLKKHLKKGGRCFGDNLEICRISPSSALIERRFLNQIGYFREDFPVCEDYELWLRATCQTEVGFINKILVVKYGGHADQLSKKYKAMDEWRVRALSNHLKNPSINKFINRREKKELVRVLKNKCQILLKGYQKHKNFKNLDEIQIIYQAVED